MPLMPGVLQLDEVIFAVLGGACILIIGMIGLIYHGICSRLDLIETRHLEFTTAVLVLASKLHPEHHSEIMDTLAGLMKNREHASRPNGGV
jgi:hypothetical protein